MRLHDVFTKELYHCDQGRAIWIPEPLESFGAVRVADVGYMDNGRFQILFNASLPADDSRQVYGVPRGFEQLHVPSTNPIDAFLPSQVLHSTTICQLDVNASMTSG